MTAKERNSNLMGISVKNTMLTYQPTWSGSATTADANEIHLVNLDQIIHWQIKQILNAMSLR